jgi:hypothetical protein
MTHNIKTGDSIVVAIDDKVLFGKVVDTRQNSVGESVIELKLDDACRYKLVRE